MLNKNSVALLLFVFLVYSHCIVLQAKTVHCDKQDTITASLASVPWREKTLERTVASLLPQVDQLNVFLNGYDHVPDFLANPKITIARSQDHGDLGDTGKFFWVDSTKGYCFTADDDLLYASDYVEYCIKKIEKYNKKVVVGLHGGNIPINMSDFQRDRIRISAFYSDYLQCDTPVHLLGTGAMAYHSDTIAISIDMFPLPNMADVWFALFAQKKCIPLITLERNKQYVLEMTETGWDQRSICFQRDKNILAGLVVNSIEWQIFSFS